MKERTAEKPKTEPASPVESVQTDGAPRADDSAKKPEGDTANLDVGKGDKKPTENKEPETVPMAAFKERLAKEKGKREKLEADLHAATGEAAKKSHLLEVALQENERLLDLLASGAKFDEKSEELHGRELVMNVKEQLAQKEQEHAQRLEALQRDQQVSQIAEQLRSEVNDACAAFPLVSPAEVRAALRANPDTDIRQFAQAKHEERKAYIAKQGGAQPNTSNLPTTVAKPTGVARFEPPLSRSGMAQALRHSRAKS